MFFGCWKGGNRGRAAKALVHVQGTSMPAQQARQVVGDLIVVL